jgi:hypothetical protein
MPLPTAITDKFLGWWKYDAGALKADVEVN